MSTDELAQAITAAKLRFEHTVGLHEPDALTLIRAAEAVQEELTELRRLFELQWRRSQEATARWRAEDPQARALILPDLGILLKWLMDDADKARAENDRSAVQHDRDLDRHDAERFDKE